MAPSVSQTKSNVSAPRPAPKPSAKAASKTATKTKRGAPKLTITNEQIDTMLAGTVFHDEIRAVIEKGYGSVLLEFRKAKNNNGKEINNLRIETVTSKLTQIPLFVL